MRLSATSTWTQQAEPDTVPPVLQPIDNPAPEIMFKRSNGELLWIDWRDFEILQDRDPDGYTVPAQDLDLFLLTAEDCVWLWSLGVSG